MNERIPVREVVTRIANRLALPTFVGARASLRRLQYKSPDQPAFWRLVVGDLKPYIADLDPQRNQDERRWAGILAGLADVAPLHRRGRKLGFACAAARVHEIRFTRLLRAHDDGLLDLLQPLAKQLANSGELVDWGDVADLVISDGGIYQDEVRRHLAQSYYSALHSQA